MTKKHEELVEEVRLLWCEECADGPLGYEYGFDPEVDDVCATGCEDLCTERARKVIALVLSAFRDGRLDEELGVVGRTDEVGSRFFDWLEGMPEEGTVIFLRPLTGTGKEEKKNGDGSGRPDQGSHQ